MPFVTATAAPATEIYYEDQGQGQPVVLIHGWPLSRDVGSADHCAGGRWLPVHRL